MAPDYKFSDSVIIQPTVDRLGDSKDAMKAHLLLRKIMEKGWMSPQQLLDRLRPALFDENAKLVEEVLILLTATVEEFDPDKTISTDLLAEVNKVISSSTSESVKKAAKKLLKSILLPEVQDDHQEVTTRTSESESESKSASELELRSSPNDSEDLVTTPSLPLATTSGDYHSVAEEDKVGIEEMIENCINLEWKERKKNLKEMEKILIEGHIITQTQLEKLKSNLSKLFGERHKEVFTSFLDVIKALVAAYHDDLGDWIDTVCAWLFSQFCKENVKSIEERIKGVLDVIRECFPGDQLLHVAMRCLNDPTLCKTSSNDGRVTVLKFIQQIIETVDPCLPAESAKAALVLLAPLLEDDSLDVMRHAQSCIVSLHNLNPQEMTGSSPVSSGSDVQASTSQAAKPSAPSKVSSGPDVPASTSQAAKPSAPSKASSKAIDLPSTSQAAKPPAPSKVSSGSDVQASTSQAAKPSAPSKKLDSPVEQSDLRNEMQALSDRMEKCLENMEKRLQENNKTQLADNQAPSGPNVPPSTRQAAKPLAPSKKLDSPVEQSDLRNEMQAMSARIEKCLENMEKRLQENNKTQLPDKQAPSGTNVSASTSQAAKPSAAPPKKLDSAGEQSDLRNEMLTRGAQLENRLATLEKQLQEKQMQVSPRPVVPTPTNLYAEPFSPYEVSPMSNLQNLFFTSCQVARRQNYSASPYQDNQWAPPRMSTQSNRGCGCSRSRCSTNHCGCRKNGYPCGSSCRCIDCCN